MRLQPQRETRTCTGSGPLTWRFPLSDEVLAVVEIHGRPGPAEVENLKRYLALIADSWIRGQAAAGTRESPAPDQVDEFAPCDIAQIRPSADATFGGLMYRVTKVNPYQVRGYLLVPHRAGMLWLAFKHHELARVGGMRWPEAEWGFRGADSAARKRMWLDPDPELARAAGER